MRKRKGTNMARTFSVDFTEDPTDLVARAEEAARRFGADFEGDTTSGSFSGKGFAGTYQISDRVATVTITEKPFLVPWGVVESQVRGFFH
jgi:hypothetical protein